MNTKLEFHGSDIEKVCEHYGLKKADPWFFLWSEFILRTDRHYV